MAQLNPNFEIDFSDINSYEQIQLINDTQLAKENLLMHRAYKEPSDDEIIRNHFSSFTFVDFLPKLFPRSQPASNQQQQQPSNLSKSPTLSGLDSKGYTYNPTSRYWELESFSELFERINSWLKLNKDWRVVSMETLVYDSISQFNQLKSSTYSAYLPQSTRGLRLFLSPSKSRFSGAQKIGCINVVPRRVSGSHLEADKQPVVYETLDDILNRLNELLLTRPIEGRILSVETITLPMVNGYVNTESNYFMDSRLNLLNESIYNLTAPLNRATGELQTPDGNSVRGHTLVDILRVYYEFGPTSCGIVNILDFLPRFYPSTTTTNTLDTTIESEEKTITAGGELNEKICATESLTRLIRRSLAWFEEERKRTLGSSEKQIIPDDLSSSAAISSIAPVNLRLCNLQVRHKTLLKRQLAHVSAQTGGGGARVLEMMNTRALAHERVSLIDSQQSQALVCNHCSSSSALEPVHDWCDHLIDLSQPYQVKFVRLAYVIPVHNSTHHHHLSIMMSATGSTAPLRPLRAHQRRRRAVTREATPNPSRVPDAPADPESISSSSSSSAASEADLSVAGCPTPFPLDCRELASALASVVSAAGNDSTELAATPTDKPSSPADMSPLEQHKQLIIATMKRHRCDEEAHQSPLADRQADDSPIGQLTYRLFAPCQLVNSSSCFAINPVNSSSPLARRGSVDLNGTSAGGNSGGSAGRLSSDNAHPSTLLLGPGNEQPASQHVVTSFGAFFPALSQDLLITDNLNDTNYAANHNHQLLGSNHNNHQSVNLTSSSSSTASNSKFTTNEFEPVDAIKRRMEIYVTTNSMKVVAGETLIVNLSDALSCLSTAIEQTLTKAPQLLGKYQAKPSTWVSVYVLYATVHETQLPDQLLAQQRLRYEQQLSLISEEPTATTTEDQQQQQREQLADAMADALFDDQFRSTPNVRTGRSLVQNDTVTKQLSSEPTLSCAISSPPAASLSTTTNSQTLDHIVPSEPSLTIYNSAYDRTVALPTQPE